MARILDGYSLGPGRCQIIVAGDTSSSFEELQTAIVQCWEGGCSSPVISPVPVSQLCGVPDSSSTLLASGRLGYVAVVSSELEQAESIDGPEDQGFINDMRSIGNHVYAVGMGRQVYRRSADSSWQSFEIGIDKRYVNFLDVTGFNAITGCGDGTLYAVGYKGEIWSCLQDRWEQIESPTNVVLQCACAIDSESVYVGGQRGVLLRGLGDEWSAIEQVAMLDDLWALEWFRGNLYVATEHSLYRLLANDELGTVDLGSNCNDSINRLHAKAGALWCFRSESQFWTADGIRWNRLSYEL